jgi:seryl-tRNA synthetase
MAGLSHCFRREAGGRAVLQGPLPRLQFTKLECSPIPARGFRKLHEELRSIEEKISRPRDPIPLVDTCNGTAAPPPRKWDLEA